MSAGRICTRIIMLGLSLGLSHSQLAAADFCDPSLLSDSKDPLSYRQRGERCEGLYVEQVAATALRLVSLTAGFAEFDPSTSETLALAWPLFDAVGSQIQLRAKGTRWRLHYRMDTRRPLPEQRYLWPTGMLDALHIGKEDLGVLGWVVSRVGGAEQPVYLPLRVTSEGDAKPVDRAYRLKVLPGLPLQELYVSIASTDAAGEPQAYLSDSEPLGYGYYPAHRVLEVPLAGITHAGLYYVELGARLRGGGASTLSFLLYHDGA